VRHRDYHKKQAYRPKQFPSVLTVSPQERAEAYAQPTTSRFDSPDSSKVLLIVFVSVHPSITPVLLGRLKLDVHRQVCRLSVAQLLVVNSQAARKTGSQIFPAWAFGCENGAVNERSLEGRVVECTSREYRALQMGSDEPTPSKITRVELAVS
jgi:hypothetical protein